MEGKRSFDNFIDPIFVTLERDPSAILTRNDWGVIWTDGNTYVTGHVIWHSRIHHPYFFVHCVMQRNKEIQYLDEQDNLWKMYHSTLTCRIDWSIKIERPNQRDQTKLLCFATWRQCYQMQRVIDLGWGPNDTH